MTVIAALGIATVAGMVTLLFEKQSRLGTVVALVGLLGTTAVALSIRPDEALPLGGSSIVGSLYLRLYLVLGGAAATLLVLLGSLVGGPATLGGVALLALAGGGLALATTDPTVAILASTAGSVAAAVVIADRRSGPRITVAARALRATVLAGLFAAGGIIWLGAAGSGLSVPGVDAVDGVGRSFGAGLVGLAYLAAACGVAIRTAAIPFHGWAARIAEATPPVGLPAALAFGPAAFAVVVIAWLDSSVGTLGEPLAVERWIVLVVAGASLLLGAVAAWLHDDVEHIVAYSLVQDAGIILLAVAALDPAAWEPVRLWILAVIAVKSALAAWAAAARHTFGTRRISELSGWARQSPVLAASFVVILVAAVGLPGLAAFDSRASLIDLVADGPVLALLVIGGLSPIGYLGRLLVTGFGRPSAFVRTAPGPMPTWPGPRLPTGRVTRMADSAGRMGRAGVRAVARAVRRSSGAAAALDTTATAQAAPVAADGDAGAAHEQARTRPRSPLQEALPIAVLRALPAAWRANRSPIAAGIVFIMAWLAITVSAGGLGAVPAAAEAAPGNGPVESFLPEGPGEPSSTLDPGGATPGAGSSVPASPVDASPTSTGAGSPDVEPSGAPSAESTLPTVDAPSANPAPSFEPVASP